MGYASHTGTRRNLAALRAAGWRVLLSATGAHPRTHRAVEGFSGYALDNGAWAAHQQNRPFDVALFTELVRVFGAGADWVACPDIVAGGLDSLRFSVSWLPWCLARVRLVLIPVQDGMTAEDVRPLLGPRVGIFVGGTTEWKLATLPVWGQVARETVCHLHVGRVNSARRIKLCAMAGADSFDGTSASRYADSLPGLDRARKQGAFAWDT